MPKREVLIPKTGGKTRPIAIASFEDKLVDWVLGRTLERLYDPLFIRNSFGYRRNKSAHDAVNYWGPLGKKRTLKLKTRKEKLIKSIQEFDRWIKENRSTMKLRDLWELAKSKIRGHVNYYGYLMNKSKIHHFYCEAVNSLFKWINRRGQRRSYMWEGFQERMKYLPLLPPWHEIAWKQPKRRRSFGCL